MARGVKGTAGILCTHPGCDRRPALDRSAPSGYRSQCAQHARETNRRYRNRIRAERGMEIRGSEEPEFSAEELPSELPPIEELRARRRGEWDRISAHKQSRQLIPVHVATDGPIGLAVFGDLHIDDPGTNFRLIEDHTQLVMKTPGMFACAVGDLQNAWIGRLARLYAMQSTSAREAWALVEWWIGEIGPKLLFINNGNHDIWTHNVNNLDPLEWIKGQHTIVGRRGVRVELRLPGGKSVTINCRHDFRGRSEWNPAFGVAKSTRLSGHVDDLALAGHIHTAGYAPLKNPLTKKVCHSLRVASYKEIDDFADETDFPDANITECFACLIDIQRSDPRHLVHCDFSLERGVETLGMLRDRWQSTAQPRRRGK